MRLAQTTHRKTRAQFLRVSRERAASSNCTPQSANSTKIRSSETRSPVQLLGKTSTVGHFSEKLNESGTFFAEPEPSAGPARRRQAAKECWSMKTPGHKFALQAETRNQQVALLQSIQELEKSPNSGHFPDFLNPATRSNEHRKCRPGKHDTQHAANEFGSKTRDDPSAQRLSRLLVEQSSGLFDAFGELASECPGRRPAAHRRARNGPFRLGAFLFARGFGGKGSLQAKGAA